MLSLTQSTPNPPPAPPLSSRKELFAHHVARGASLAQAARLAGYSPQGARQRGSVLMADSDVRLRVETLRHVWMAERQGRVDQAVEQLDRIVEMAMELQRPTAALKAMDMLLRLTGVIRDTRAGLYADSPDDDLSKAFFDPREDEDPDFNPDSYPAPAPVPTEIEDDIPEPDEPDEPADPDPASAPAENVQLMTSAASSPQSTRPLPLPAPPPPPPLDVGQAAAAAPGIRSATLSDWDHPIRRQAGAGRPLHPAAPGFQK
jgi:phage terminase small subunit